MYCRMPYAKNITYNLAFAIFKVHLRRSRSGSQDPGFVGGSPGQEGFPRSAVGAEHDGSGDRVHQRGLGARLDRTRRGIYVYQHLGDALRYDTSSTFWPFFFHG